MRLIYIIGLIILLLIVPIPTVAQSATPAATSPVAVSGDFSAWSTSVAAASSTPAS